MYWDDGVAFKQVTDHNRSSLSVSYERIENKQRMADGTLRRYTVAKKRSFQLSWEMLPSRTAPGGNNTVDGGLNGEQIEEFHDAHDNAFDAKIMDGQGGEEIVTVMITDFSKEIVKRSQYVDYWTLDITLEEV